ncbi:MAG TPA: SCP2 sterol-binding domain-containing protein [Acidimicrobiales bacterium]|nr:SCP2 sterol-binding domain-containing protein [Acidimicrobiales bacterium]
MPRYLSAEWFEDVNQAASGNDQLRTDTAGVTLTIQQVVTGSPDGDVHYTVRVRDGAVDVNLGDDPAADVTMTEAWDTAVKVASGGLSPATAFMTGRIRVAGNVGALLDAQGSLRELDKVFEGLRERTTF